MLVRSILTFTGLVLLSAAVVPSVKADEWNKKTVMTINETVQLPHTVLQPGTYVFKLLDSASDRHIVQIFDADGTHLISTILAIPNYRLRPTGKTLFQFWETPAGHPKAMRAWFYPGDNFGQEFAYPKTLSVQIAKDANAPVPTLMTDTENEADLKVAPVVDVDETGKETPLQQTEPVVAQNETPAPPAPQASAEPEPTPAAAPEAAPVADTTPAPKSLPHTASPMPLIALLGLASIAAFGLLRLANRD